MMGHREVCDALKAAGAEIDSKDAHRATPLYVTTWNSHHEACKPLLAAGARVNAQGERAGPLLQAAADRGICDTL